MIIHVNDWMAARIPRARNPRRCFQVRRTFKLAPIENKSETGQKHQKGSTCLASHPSIHQSIHPSTSALIIATSTITITTITTITTSTPPPPTTTTFETRTMPIIDMAARIPRARNPRRYPGIVAWNKDSWLLTALWGTTVIRTDMITDWMYVC